MSFYNKLKNNLGEVATGDTELTASATELNALDGIAADAAELSLLDGVTATTAELNILDGVTATAAELNILDGVLATAAEINRACDASTRIVNVTAATLAVTEAAHDGKTITLNRAGGITATLPAATGSGTRLKFVVGTTFTSDGIIQVTGDDTMTGIAWIAQDAADTVVAFEAGATADTITLNGTTTGGLKGDIVYLEDIAADLWSVDVRLSATGSEATPFSAAV